MTDTAFIRIGNDLLNRAIRIAAGDIYGNITLYQDGLLKEPSKAVMAGLDYNTPWTRDAAINVWNGLALVFPEVSKNTLLSVLVEREGKVVIGGQYWDKIIWTVGAWQYYLATGDNGFLSLAYEASLNSMLESETNEFSKDLGLFRGPACYGDGVAAYPDRYAVTGGSSEILEWTRHNAGLCASNGYGIPMHALSTNCIYYHAYVLLDQMQSQLATKQKVEWKKKAEALKIAINKEFWNDSNNRYRYLVDSFGGCENQEGLGNALAVLLGVADETQRTGVFESVYIAPAGIPCVWPSYDRYSSTTDNTCGRHSGTVWPHIQGFWADAALQSGNEPVFVNELMQLSKHICRDKQCAEIYHPITGEIYGGLQEYPGKGIIEWEACSRQTWSATALLRMVFCGLAGLRLEPGGIRFKPFLPEGTEYVEMMHLRYRDTLMNIKIEGRGRKVAEFSVNGKRRDNCFIEASCKELLNIRIKVE